MCRKTNPKSNAPAWSECAAGWRVRAHHHCTTALTHHALLTACLLPTVRVYMDDETFYEKSSNPTARAIWRYRDTPRALPTTTEWDAAWLGSAAGSSGMLGGNADVIDFYNLKPIDPNGPPDYTELIQLQVRGPAAKSCGYGSTQALAKE